MASVEPLSWNPGVIHPKFLPICPCSGTRPATNFARFASCAPSVFKQFVLADLEGITDIDAAIPLKNRIVYAARGDLDPGDGYFIADLIGLPVIDQTIGAEAGKLSDVINRGAQDIYVIDTPAGERMIPAVDEFIARIDLDSGVYITPIPGMLD